MSTAIISIWCHQCPHFSTPNVRWIFRENAAYWQETGYPRQEFNSWWLPKSDWPRAGVLGEYIHHLLRRLPTGAAPDQISGVEMWVHRRPSAPSGAHRSWNPDRATSGHQLHYDTDEQSLVYGVVGGARHPEYSSVMFLEGAVGGVTFIANHSTMPATGDTYTYFEDEDEYDADEDPHNLGWVVSPKTNRMITFKGTCNVRQCLILATT